MSPSAPGIRVDAPATVGNFGPGFDAFALALHGVGDRIEVGPSDEDRIEVEGAGAEAIPRAWRKNVVGLVFDHLRAATGVDSRFSIRLRKGIPGGSGLGSSASSAGGAALAFHGLHRRLGLSPESLVRAAGEGEAGASGRHYDDVAAVVMGGLAIVRQRRDGLAVHRVQPPKDLHLAVVVPKIALLTADMRALLPAKVDREDAVRNLGNAAALVDAFHRNDIASVGACFEDRIATPARKVRVPYFDDVYQAALEAGAHGAGLSGSGPSMVAVCDNRRTATRAAAEMASAVERHKIKADAFAAVPEREVMHRAV